MIDWNEIQEAERFLRGHFALSRLVPAPSLVKGTGVPVYLKLESEMRTGSFKPRGALYALSRQMERAGANEVVASSTGNHGAAVAYAAKLRGVGATIFLPRNPNPLKAAKIASLGARIEEGAGDFAAAREAAAAYATRTGAYLMDDATDADIPIGAGTMALEILAELPDVQTIIVPVGDSALIRGVAAAANGAHVRAREEAEWGAGAPRATEPGYGAEPHVGKKPGVR